MNDETARYMLKVRIFIMSIGIIMALCAALVIPSTLSQFAATNYYTHQRLLAETNVDRYLTLLTISFTRQVIFQPLTLGIYFSGLVVGLLVAWGFGIAFLLRRRELKHLIKV